MNGGTKEQGSLSDSLGLTSRHVVGVEDHQQEG